MHRIRIVKANVEQGGLAKNPENFNHIFSTGLTNDTVEVSCLSIGADESQNVERVCTGMVVNVGEWGLDGEWGLADEAEYNKFMDECSDDHIDKSGVGFKRSKSKVCGNTYSTRQEALVALSSQMTSAILSDINR